MKNSDAKKSKYDTLSQQPCANRGVGSWESANSGMGALMGSSEPTGV